MTEEKIITGTAKPKTKADPYIIGLYITLCIVSVIESYSASSREIAVAGSIYTPMLKHMGLLCAGTFFMWIAQRMNYMTIMRLSPLLVLGTLAVMVCTMLFGEMINGARRGIDLGFFTLQSAELAKLSVVFVLAYFLARNLRNNTIDNRGLSWCVVIIAVFGGLLLMQGMTNTILFMSVSFSLLIIGGTKGKKLLSVVAIYILMGLAFLAIKDFAESNKREDLNAEPETAAVQENKESVLRDETWGGRIERYMDNWTGAPAYERPITQKNQQEMFSFMAQANGGIAGVFPGNSVETSRLPLAFSDYVFSIIVEDTGFLGGVFLICIYFFLLIRAGNIARKCSRAYPALLVMGMAVMIVLQAFFHMAITTGVFPVSGQPLPLISKGGTSIFVTGIAFGVMLSVSRTAVQTTVKKDINQEKAALPEAMRADNPTREVN